MQQKVAVDPFGLAQFRQVAIGAAYGLEGRLAGFDLAASFSPAGLLALGAGRLRT